MLVMMNVDLQELSLRRTDVQQRLGSKWRLGGKERLYQWWHRRRGVLGAECCGQ
jgi:hypothetical protein